MKTLLIEVTNQKAYGLLKELEELKIIRVLLGDERIPNPSLSERFAGKLSGAVADDLHKQLQKMRQEWNERT